MTRESFMSAYERWVDEPFPGGSEDNGLDEIHAQLAYADAMVAEAALPLAKNLLQSGNVPDQVRTELRMAKARTDEYSSSENKEHARLALMYRRYAEVLQRVIDELG